MSLALGTAQFGSRYGVANRQGEITVNEGAAILTLARAHGIDTLDTAISYGDSEQRLGELGVSDWRVVSKLPAAPASCTDMAGWVEAEVVASLGRLEVPHLEGLLLHRPAQLCEPGGEGLWRALERLKTLGFVRKIGISIYEPSELKNIVGRVPVDLVQAPLNVLDRRLVDSGWLARLASAGVEVHARSVFLQGLLVMPSATRPAHFAKWAWLLGTYDAWVEQSGRTPMQACLGYVLAIPEINRVVIGVDSAAQLEDLLRVAPVQDPPPNEIRCDDAELVNPSRWAQL